MKCLQITVGFFWKCFGLYQVRPVKHFIKHAYIIWFDLPSVQLTPVHPAVHVHSNEPSVFVQSPPLAQGCWSSHSLMS